LLQKFRDNGEEIDLVSKAVLAVHGLLESDDERSVGIGAKLVLAMESQNQADIPTESTVRHTHEIGPQAAATIEQRKQEAARRFAVLTNSNRSGDGGD
jgi:hypothetical protein